MRKTILLLSIVGLIYFPKIYSQKNLIAPAIRKNFVVVEGHKMFYEVAGSGQVTVIFESGHDDDHSAWNDVFPSIAKVTRTVSYDRLGMGASEATGKPRTYEQIATELHEMLEQAKISAPYILVGHSMGGALIRAFEKLYQDETIGLVLLDPFNEFETSGMPKEILENEMKMADSIMKVKSHTVQAEFNFMQHELLSGFPELSSYSFADVPTVLMVAGADRPPGWMKNGIDFFQQKIVGLSDARLVVLPQSPHYIQHYDAASVIENIKRVLYPNANVALRKIYKEKGADSAIARSKKMKQTYPSEYFQENILNSLGYAALANKDTTGAIRLFVVNVIFHPASSNVYDSLGEAYMDAGNKKEAVKNYERSLALDPNNNNAVRMLKKLKDK